MYINVLFEKHYYGEEKEYSILCPSCHKKICYFCLTPVVNSWFAKCCTKRKLYIMHDKGITYSKERDNHFYDAEKEAIMIFIPGISLIFLVGIFFNAFFYKIVRKHYDIKNHDLTYEHNLRKRDKRYWMVNIAINGFTSIIMVIPFFIFNITISILLLILIIIRSKWFFYIIGFLNEDWHFLNKNLNYIC